MVVFTYAQYGIQIQTVYIHFLSSNLLYLLLTGH